MDKNTLVGFTLIGAVLIGFSIYNRPSQEEMERAQRYQDSIQTVAQLEQAKRCLLYTSPSPRDGLLSRMPSSA